MHFLYATSLKQIGRGADALSQVLALLEEQHSGKTRETDTLTYWQRRAGNEIANQFYQEGEPLKALDIYLILAALDLRPNGNFRSGTSSGWSMSGSTSPRRLSNTTGTSRGGKKNCPPPPRPASKP